MPTTEELFAQLQGLSTPAPQAQPQASTEDLFAQLKGLSAQPMKEEGPSFMQSVGDVFTGNLRETPEMTGEKMPDKGKAMINDMSILGGQANQAKFALATTNMFNADEMAKVAVGINPDLEVRHNKDAKGNVYPILTNTKTGVNSMINLPGIDPTDVLKGVTSAAIFARTGGKGQGAQRVLSGASRAGGLQGLSEMKDKFVGGDFNAGEIALTAGMGGLGEAVPMVASVVWRKLFGKSKGGANPIDGLSPDQQARVSDLKQGYESKKGELTSEQKLEQMKQAFATGDKSKIAAMVTVDDEYVRAVKTLGLEEKGIISFATSDLQVQQIDQALKAVPGSTLANDAKLAINEVMQKSEDLILEFGGNLERADASEHLLTSVKNTISKLGDEAEVVYDGIKKAIPPTATTKLDNVGQFVTGELSKARGNIGELSALEKRLLALYKNVPKERVHFGIKSIDETNAPTYHIIDKIRKEVGETLGKKSTQFADESTAKLKKLYSLLTDDQEIVANQFKMGEAWGVGKEMVKRRKVLEDDAILMFGKDLDKNFFSKFTKAVTGLKKTEFTEFRKLIEAVPKENREEVMVTALKGVFATAGGKNTQMTLPVFANWHKNLNANPKLKAEVYSHFPKKMTKQLDALGKVADNIRNATAEVPAGGRIMAAPGVLNRVVNGIGDKILVKVIGRIPGFGIVGDMASAGLKVGKGKGEDAALAMIKKPEFMAGLKALKNGQAEKAAALEKQLMRTKEFKDFLKTVTEQERNLIIRQGFGNWLASEEEQ